MMKIYEIKDEKGEVVLKANAKEREDLEKIEAFFGKSLSMINYDLAKYKYIRKDDQKYTLSVMFIEFMEDKNE